MCCVRLRVPDYSNTDNDDSVLHRRTGRHDTDGRWYCARCWWVWDPSGQGFTHEARENRELDRRLREEFAPSLEEYRDEYVQA